MKKFIYSLVTLLLIVPVAVFAINKNGKKIEYKTNTSTSTKMIKTTLLIDHSNKKREEEEKAKQEELQKKKEEEERKKEVARLEKIEEEKKKKAEATTKAVTETEIISSRQQVTISDDQEIKNANVNQSEGASNTVTSNSEKRVFEGAKFYDRYMSSYGTDCCASTAYKEKRKSQGLTEFPTEDEILEKTLAGVGLGLTASGYQFKYKDVWFNAGSYGMVRMVAADHYGQYDFPLGTVVKITEKMTDGSETEMKAIVIDRGDYNIGLDDKPNGKHRRIFDLVSETTLAAKNYGVHNWITVEVLHVGTKEDLYNIRHYGHL